MKEILGPFTDIPASDIGTDERHMWALAGAG